MSIADHLYSREALDLLLLTDSCDEKEFKSASRNFTGLIALVI
jgi:hypothetical protein